jgi:hypothetical protein
LYVAQLPSLFLGCIEIFLHLGIFLEIQSDKLRGFLSAEVGGLLQSIVAHAINDSKIDRFGISAHFRGHLIRGDAEDFRGSRGVDILVVGKGSDETGVLREVG